MAKAKDKVKETLAAVDAIKTILEELGDGKSLSDIDFSLHPGFDFKFNAQISINPFEYLIALLSKFMTYEEMVEWLADKLVYELPVIELAIKGVLLATLKQGIDCNNDPRIPEKYRRKLNNVNTIISGEEEIDVNRKIDRGILVTFSEIDFNNMLGVSPISELGQDLYFGCRRYYAIEDGNGKEEKRFYNYKSAVKGAQELNVDIDSIVDKSEISTIWELTRAEDFDAFLWFATHKSKFLFPKKAVYSNTANCYSLSEAMFESKFPFRGTPIENSILNVVYGNEPLRSISDIPSFKAGNTLLQVSGDTKSSILSLCIKEETQTDSEMTDFASQSVVSNLANRQLQEYSFGSSLVTSTLNADPRIYEDKFFDYSNEVYFLIDGEKVSEKEYASSDVEAKTRTRYQRTTFNNANFIRRERYADGVIKTVAFISKGLNFKGETYHTSWEGSVDDEGYKEAERTFRNNFEYERTVWNEYAEQYNRKTKRDLADDIEEWKGLDEAERNVRRLNKELAEQQENLKNQALTTMESFKDDSIVDLPEESVVAESSFGTDGDMSNTMLKDVVLTSASEMHSFQMVPVSYDALSVNWYVNRKTYFDFLKREEKRKERNYEEEFALCNLRFTGNINRLQLEDASEEGVVMTIMPRPFWHMPFGDSFDFRIEDFSKSTFQMKGKLGKGALPKRILFDANGKPTQRGKYTVRVKNNKANYNEEHKMYWYDLYSIDDKLVNRLLISNKDGKYSLEKTESFDLALTLHECYPGITIYEFNYDFIMGMRLYDAHVVASKLIMSLCNMRGGLTIGLDNINKYETPYQMRISKIVKNVVESVSSELSDCFFNFSNDEYNAMLEESEMRRANLMPFADSDNKATTLDVTAIRDALNEYNDNATKQENKEVLVRAINVASAAITEEVLPKDKYALRLNFVQDLIRLFAQILIDALLSPKVMMLIIVNQKIMNKDALGKNGKKDWEDILKSLQNVIIGIVKEITNMIIQMILEEVLKRIMVLVAKIAERIVAEQLDAYMRVIRELVENCVPSFLFRRAKNLPTELDKVDFAEIDDREIMTTQEC